MPSAREMLQIVAEDPIAQARYFILSMRLFCEHVLGTGPFDGHLRHNGKLESPAFPDGFAASGLGGAFGMIAACHGPVEEQARLSIHPHMLLWFVSSTSEAWLRSILRRETEEARAGGKSVCWRPCSPPTSIQLRSYRCCCPTTPAQRLRLGRRRFPCSSKTIVASTVRQRVTRVMRTSNDLWLRQRTSSSTTTCRGIARVFQPAWSRGQITCFH